MKLARLTWSISLECDSGDDRWSSESLPGPSWPDIETALRRLDGRMYPSLTLALTQQPPPARILTIIGGPEGYTASLALGPQPGGWMQATQQYINPACFSRYDRSPVRAIGNGYTNYEIEEGFLTTDYMLIEGIVRHFAEAGTWYPRAAFMIVGVHEDGELYELF